MNIVLGIAREVYGLFVESGWYALAILVWIGISAALVTIAGPRAGAFLLVAGLAAVLVFDVIRAARR